MVKNIVDGFFYYLCQLDLNIVGVPRFVSFEGICLLWMNYNMNLEKKLEMVLLMLTLSVKYIMKDIKFL